MTRNGHLFITTYYLDSLWSNETIQVNITWDRLPTQLPHYLGAHTNLIIQVLGSFMINYFIDILKKKKKNISMLMHVKLLVHSHLFRLFETCLGKNYSFLVCQP